MMNSDTMTIPPGFLAGALHSGIKESGKPDLAMLVSRVPATAAAVFTTNKILGAPVVVAQRHIRRGILHACVINSGRANVCTGERGLCDAREMCSLTAAALRSLALDATANQILPASTGVIGRFLPMDALRGGISRLAGALGDSREHSQEFARGILTTDTRRKIARAVLSISGRRIVITGWCKGSGMIAPNMATMLAFVATDAALDAAALRAAVRHVAHDTFNCLTIDQHTSTSDMFVCLANGLAGNRRITSLSPAWKKFTAALREVCDSLCRQIAADGEGATKLVRVFVTGAVSETEARQAALAIANSPLVKTAIHGGDPNWGRFVSAAGYSGAKMNPDRARCRVGDIEVFKLGRPTEADMAAVEAVMKLSELDITVDLGAGGKGRCRVYTCDLSRRYIEINADYHT